MEHSATAATSEVDRKVGPPISVGCSREAEGFAQAWLTSAHEGRVARHRILSSTTILISITLSGVSVVVML